MISLDKFLFSLLIVFGLAGCSSFSSTYSMQNSSTLNSSVGEPVPEDSAVLLPSVARVDVKNPNEIRHRLLKQLDEWQGVPYLYGGLSKRGVDCSGFTYVTFAEQFGIRLPRTTGSQVKKGIVVGQDELLPGDLIFFYTGYKQRHMGVYVGKKQFMHASSSRGVMVSRLDNPYWQGAYWHSRRVL